jgi:hypothetical protein
MSNILKSTPVTEFTTNNQRILNSKLSSLSRADSRAKSDKSIRAYFASEQEAWRTVRTEGFRGFAQSFNANSGIMPR